MMRYARLFAAAAAALGLLAGCGGDEGKKMETITVPVDKIVSLNVVADCGSVTVRPAAGKNFRITPRYAITAPSRERRELIAQNVTVTPDTASDPSILSVYSGVSDHVTLDPAAERAVVDLEIEIPEKIGSVIVQSQEGDILLDGLRGCEVSLVGSEGNIAVRDSILTGNNHVINVVGDIDLRLKSIAGAESIEASTDAGDIHLDVPRSASFTVTLEELSQQGITWQKKDGKTQIRLVSKIGKVDFPRR